MENDFKKTDVRYKRYRRDKYQQWKDKVKKRLPGVVLGFYSIDKLIDYTIHKKLGRVIMNINDPYYPYNPDGSNNTDIDLLSREVILEIDVEDLLSFVATQHPINPPI